MCVAKPTHWHVKTNQKPICSTRKVGKRMSWLVSNEDGIGEEVGIIFPCSDITNSHNSI